MIRRKIELEQPDGTFVEVTFRSLKKGDRFRMFEPEDGLHGAGEPCHDGKVFTACEDASPPPPYSLDSVQPPEGEERAWGIRVEEDVDVLPGQAG